LGAVQKELTLPFHVPMNAMLARLKENPLANYAVIAIAVLAFCARAVPFGNEYVYLLRLKRTYDPTFLLNDVSFAAPATEHWFFNHIFGLFTYIASLEVIAWTGRVACWVVLIYALQRLARHWRIPLWMATGGILLWLAAGQTVVGGEWMIGTFEAKSLAYICLIFAIDGVLRERVTYPGILLGLTFSFHPAVGMWSILAIGIALLVSRRPLINITKLASLTLVFSLLGLIPLLISGTANAAADDWRFLELVRFPQIFDPLSWPKTAIVLVYLQLAFCVMVYLKADREKTDTFLIAFLSALAVFFTFGLLLRVSGQFAVMQLMPTRLFPVFAPLFFFWYLARAFEQRVFAPPLKSLAVVAFLAIMLWQSPFATANDEFHQTVESWQDGEDTTEAAFKWIAANTPNAAIAIAPPWRQDYWWQTRRAQVVSWNFPTYSDLGRWHSRVQALAGDTPRTKEGDTRTEFYYSLPKDKLDAIARETGAEYLVSDTIYPYPVLFQSGETRVYKLR
jgi:hypothetical protein